MRALALQKSSRGPPQTRLTFFWILGHFKLHSDFRTLGNGMMQVSHEHCFVDAATREIHRWTEGEQTYK